MALSKYDIQIDLANRAGTSHAMLVEMVGANKRVLDVGCDTGYLGEALMALGNRASGVEINEVTAAAARSKLDRVEVGDLETIDLVGIFGPGSFDVVVFGDVLEHLRQPLAVLRQARPLLAEGGSVLISTPNIAHGDIRLALLRGRFNYTKTGILDETHTRFFTRDSLVEFLHDAGFVMTELRRTKADLFATETDLRPEDFDPALIDELRRDPEATTYQFVVRAVPDDASALSSQQALRFDELTTELASERAHGAEARAERDELARRLEQAQQAAAEAGERALAEITRLTEELDKVAKGRDELAAELQAIHNTKIMRATRQARAAYGRLRHDQGRQ